MIFHGLIDMGKKANKVKANLNESIKAQSKLYEFLDANPRGTGREAYNFLTKRHVSKEVAISTIKQYGQEDLQFGHLVGLANKPALVNAEDDRLKNSNNIKIQNEDGNTLLKPDKPLSGEDLGHGLIQDPVLGGQTDFPYNQEQPNIAGLPTVGGYGDIEPHDRMRGVTQMGEGGLNTNIGTKSNEDHMANDNSSGNNEFPPKKKEQVEEQADTEHQNVERPVADVDEAQAQGVHTDGGGGNCPPDATGAQQHWNPVTRKCEPKDSGNVNGRGPAGVVSNVSEYRRPNADIASEKRRVQEYYKKLDKLEAVRNMKVADARISAKEKYLKEKRLDRLIREAKSGVQKRAPVVSRPAMKIGESARTRISAGEAEVAGPVSWMKNVAQEKNVSPSYVWHVNKQRIYDQAGERFVKDFDANENAKYTPLTETQKVPATETVTGPASNDFMRIMSEQVLVLPNGKVVTPIRQFCETKVLAPGTKEAFFYDFGAVNFSAVTEDGSTQVGESAVTIRSSGGPATPRGTKLTIGYTQLEESPIDIVSAANRSYALESVNDESVEVLDRAYNDDVGSSGDASNRKDKGGGVKTNRWVDHAGTQVTADASGLSNLTFAGLVAAKGVIEDEGLDPSNLVTYTTGKAIRDLIFDPDLDSFISFSRPAIITEATVERIAGTNVVRSSAPSAGTQANSFRSTMFVPNIAFGLITGRDLTMEAQRRNELQVVFLTGTQRIAGFVKNVEATCRISHT